MSLWRKRLISPIAQAGAVDDAGVVVLVQDHDIAAADQGADGAQVDLHAGREDQRCFLAHPLGQLALQLLVHLQGAVQEARAGATGAVAVDGVDGCLAHLGVGGQAQVVVGAAHDQAVAVEDRFACLRSPSVG